MKTIRLFLADISYYLSNKAKHLYTLYSQKHFTFVHALWTFRSKHLIPQNLKGFYVFASISEGNK